METQPLKKRKQQAMETRERIYTAATELIEEKGFENVQIEDISRRANVSMGLFYNYFSSKADVLTESFIVNSNAYHRDIYNTYLQNVCGLEKLDTFIHRLSDLRIKEYKIRDFRYHYINIMQNVNRNAATRQGSIIVSILTEALKEAIDRGEIYANAPIEKMVSQISIIIRGATLDYVFFNESGSRNLEETTVELVTAYLSSYRTGLYT